MNDTPRTDAIAHRGYHLDVLVARSIDLCRELERENAALREKISELEKAFAPNFVRELHIACLELERENAALKKQANDEFDTVITRNMELVRENGRLRMALDASCNAEELRQVRAENAVLREALMFYGDCQTYGLNGGNMKRILTDAGALARHALRKEAKP